MPKVIALDFDGTIFTQVPKGWTGSKHAGEPIWSEINRAKRERTEGAILILWTSREGEDLQNAVDACRSVGLEFEAVNENCQMMLDRYGPSRKIHADVYRDDKAEKVGGV